MFLKLIFFNIFFFSLVLNDSLAVPTDRSDNTAAKELEQPSNANKLSEPALEEENETLEKNVENVDSEPASLDKTAAENIPSVSKEENAVNKDAPINEGAQGSILIDILSQRKNSRPEKVIDEEPQPVQPVPSQEEDAEVKSDQKEDAEVKLDQEEDQLAYANETKNDSGDFYVITAIFNPASYQSRYNLYHEFAYQIRSSGAQLVTIEAIFPSLGQEEFQVTSWENPLDIQLKSESVYWVKEDLINIAASKLPENARWISWLDADIEFHDEDWIEQTISALDRHSVVQMFKYAHFLNSEGEIMRTDYSFGYSLVHGKPLLGFKENDWYPHPGYGWAMSKSTFDRIGGLPSFDIIGGGDLYFAYTLVKHVPDIVDSEFEENYKKKIIETSQATYETLARISEEESKTVAGFAPVTISHHWHGSQKDRGYVNRLNILIAHEFDFNRDMLRGCDGLLRFRNYTDSLQQDVRCYFESRNEDGNKDGPSKCHSHEYSVFLSSRRNEEDQEKCPAKENTCGCGGKPDSNTPGHYNGKHYTYYTTYNYNGILNSEAIDGIVKLSRFKLSSD